MRLITFLASTAAGLTFAAPSPNGNAKPLSFPVPAPALPSESQGLSSFFANNVADKRALIPQPRHVIKERQVANGTNGTNPISSGPPQATVQLCTATNFAGECYNSTWPINTCIDLRGYAGQTLSFAPSPGSSCLLTQNRCDASDFYIEVSGDDEAELEQGADLSNLEWIEKSKSYICFADINVLRRFVVRARLRVVDAAPAAEKRSSME